MKRTTSNVQSEFRRADQRRPTRFLLPGVVVILALAGSPGAARASLTSSASGDVSPSNPASWTTSTTDYVGNTGSGTLSVSAGTLLSGVSYLGYASGSSGTAPVSGAGTTWTNSVFFVGESGGGTLSVSGGAAAGGPAGPIPNPNPFGIIGDKAGSTGSVIVNGPGSTWGQLYSLAIGNSGSGSMLVIGGGTVASGGVSMGQYTGSWGTATVSGSGSLWTNAAYPYDATYGSLYVGGSGRASLTVSNGGRVTTGGYYGDAIGELAGSSGTVTVTGAGSTWTSTDDLFIGDNGNGAMIVSNGASGRGGSLEAGTCIGYQAGSTGLLAVSGSGSTWTSSGGFNVGDYGSGTMAVTSGGSVSAGPYIGYAAGSNGNVMVDGLGSTWSTPSLYVGYSGSGTLTISHSGTVTVAGATKVACNASSSGVINFGAGGGTLSTQTIWGSPAILTGTGTIVTTGLVSDVNLLFDASHAPSQTFILSGSNQDIAVNINLSNPNNVGDLGVGYAGSASLTVGNGITVNCGNCYLGYLAGSSGTATVAGGNLQVSTTGVLFVGYNGRATLAISSGGTVSSYYATIGDNAGSSGLVTVSGANSTWNVPNGFNNVLGVGTAGSGTLSILNGGAVNCQNAYCEIAAGYNTTGAMTVDGSGSTFLSYDTLYAGYFGNATVKVVNGASLISWGGVLAYTPTATGIVTVAGSGSKWSNNNGINVGDSGGGTLAVAGGGAVTATGLAIASTSLAEIDVGHGSSLSVGSGTIANSGTIRVVAGADVATGGTYAPITGVWSGTGKVQAVGGTWNSSSHQFTVSSVQSGAAGQQVSVNLASVQRIAVSDSASGWSLGASFLDKSASLTFSATALSGSSLGLLDDVVGPNEQVLGGWFFAANSGYTPGDPDYLSFDIGSGYSPDELKVWRYSGSTWAPLAASDLTYDGTYASFTATDLNGYAVGGQNVPEPSTLLLLGAAIASFVGYGLRRQTRRRLDVVGALDDDRQPSRT